MKSFNFLLFALIILLISSCQQPPEIIEEKYQPKYEHEAYTLALQSLAMGKTRLGEIWLSEAKDALTNPMHVDAPYATDIYVSDTEARSFGYHFSTALGQKITVTLSTQKEDDGKMFLDVFRVGDQDGDPYVHMASIDSVSQTITFEPTADYEYIVRLQPELLIRGKYRLEIRSEAALAFPVSGKDKSAIGSLFGVPRDAGRRVHHGIDIFARRHTPIVAPCDGYIGSTEPNDRGGEVIWMRDDQRNQVLYFAHLHNVFVTQGQEVSRGDTIGTVGNTGNARTTAPHLHFGLYNNGPIDPYDHVVPPKGRFKKELAKKKLIGQIVRVNNSSVLRTLDEQDTKFTLSDHQYCLVLGTNGHYYHVQLPNDLEGYISYDTIEILERPIRMNLPNNGFIIDRPQDPIIISDILLSEAKVYAVHDSYLYVKLDDQYLWVETS